MLHVLPVSLCVSPMIKNKCSQSNALIKVWIWSIGAAQQLLTAPHKRMDQMQKTNFTAHHNVYVWPIKYPLLFYINVIVNLCVENPAFHRILYLQTLKIGIIKSSSQSRILSPAIIIFCNCSCLTCKTLILWPLIPSTHFG